MKLLFSVLCVCLILNSCNKGVTQADYTGTYTASYTQVVKQGPAAATNTGVTEIEIKKGSTESRLLFKDQVFGVFEVQLNGNRFIQADPTQEEQITGQFTGDEFSYHSSLTIATNSRITDVKGRRQ